MDKQNEHRIRQTCRHFTGIMNDACEKGVNYMSVRVLPPVGMAQWPCTDTQHDNCPLREYLSEAEADAKIAATNQMITEMLSGLSGLMLRESETCLHCKGHIDALEQVGRCVYARPCGCRQYQGTVPEAWK